MESTKTFRKYNFLSVITFVIAVTALVISIHNLTKENSTSTSTPELLDGATAGTVVNGKAVIYGDNGEVNATTLQIDSNNITATATEINFLNGAQSGVSVEETAVIYGDNGEVVGKIIAEGVNPPSSNSPGSEGEIRTDTDTSTVTKYLYAFSNNQWGRVALETWEV